MKDLASLVATLSPPFAHSLFTTQLSGAQFKTVREQQWQRDRTGAVPSRPYLQLGLSYSFDESLPEGATKPTSPSGALGSRHDDHEGPVCPGTEKQAASLKAAASVERGSRTPTLAIGPTTVTLQDSLKGVVPFPGRDLRPTTEAQRPAEPYGGAMMEFGILGFTFGLLGLIFGIVGFVIATSVHKRLTSTTRRVAALESGSTVPTSGLQLEQATTPALPAPTSWPTLGQVEPVSFGTQLLPAELVQEVVVLLRNNLDVRAIKRVREVTGLGLKDAKDAVDLIKQRHA